MRGWNIDELRCTDGRFSVNRYVPKYLKWIQASASDSSSLCNRKISPARPRDHNLVSKSQHASNSIALLGIKTTMDEERERRQRDLAHATRLLHTMSREDMFELLHYILYNERSDDTRTLSDWMAFQVILAETCETRKLRQQLGKVRNAHQNPP